MPIMRLIMNSSRASPTPRCGRLAKANARSGLPTFIMILTGISGIASSSISRRTNGNFPVNTRPVSPSAHETVTSWPGLTRSVASPHPTTAGTPSSRAMIAAWQVRPPRLVTIAAARFITGSQSGSVISVISTSPSAKSAIIERSVITRATPLPMRCPMLRPSTNISLRACKS